MSAALLLTITLPGGAGAFIIAGFMVCLLCLRRKRCDDQAIATLRKWRAGR